VAARVDFGWARLHAGYGICKVPAPSVNNRVCCIFAGLGISQFAKHFSLENKPFTSLFHDTLLGWDHIANAAGLAKDLMLKHYQHLQNATSKQFCQEPMSAVGRWDGHEW
jgi:hypothetical protein